MVSKLLILVSLLLTTVHHFPVTFGQATITTTIPSQINSRQQQSSIQQLKRRRRNLIPNNNSTKTTNSTVSSSTKKKDCKNLADFFYDIVLAISTFPTAKCTQREEIFVSQFVQSQLNIAVRNIPGTIRTQNKLCTEPINHRRLLLSNEKEKDNMMFSHDRRRNLFSRNLNTEDDSDDEEEKKRRFLNFIYRGGGRCRFCFGDDQDKRRLLIQRGIDEQVFGKENEYIDDKEEEEEEKTRTSNHRNLLYYYFDDDVIDIEKNVVQDPVECKQVRQDWIYNSTFTTTGTAEGWTNAKFVVKNRPAPMGPYNGGETLGITLSTRQNKGKGLTKKKMKQEGATDKKSLPRKALVKSARIVLTMLAVDVPAQYTKEFLGDDPLYVLVNGIKMDLGQMAGSPGAVQTETSRGVAGETFAGIMFGFGDGIKPQNLAGGKELERLHSIQLTIPHIIFDHTDELDIRLIFNPHAKAKYYFITNFDVAIWSLGCKVLGQLDNTPFDKFKQITEQKLSQQLGFALAKEFQSSRHSNHCFRDKVPIVGVNLIEKENWKEANPRCGR